MGEPWITMFATLLGLIGVLAEFNLLRIFLCVIGERAGVRKAAASIRCASSQPGTAGLAAAIRIRVALSAACVTAGLLPAAVHSQDSSSTTPPERASNMTSTDLLSP